MILRLETEPGESIRQVAASLVSLAMSHRIRVETTFNDVPVFARVWPNADTVGDVVGRYLEATTPPGRRAG